MAAVSALPPDGNPPQDSGAFRSALVLPISRQEARSASRLDKMTNALVLASKVPSLQQRLPELFAAAAGEKRSRSSDDNDTRREGPAKVMRKDGVTPMFASTADPISEVEAEAGEADESSVPTGFGTTVGAEPVQLDGSKLPTDPHRTMPQKRVQKPPVSAARSVG